MKRTICLFLTVFMLAFSVVPVSGAETNKLEEQRVITPMFVHIHYMVAGLKIDTSGKATAYGMGRTYSASHTINVNVDLQKFSGSSWNTIKSWNDSGPGYPSGVRLERDWYVTKGTYRAFVTVRVYNSYGQLLETQSETSPIQTY